ncbi:MAG: helix-turn-helix domain-containing protein [Crenarchaeota archaeon]|nr:helix-turn-helix domain-containing protein [Thermoproteota archaeon]
MSELYSPKDVCRELDISYITLWRWIKEGKVKADRLPSGRYAIPRSEVERIKGLYEVVFKHI